MTITLRPYQVDACAAIHRELGRVRSTLLVMATGTGKTTIFADVARERRCLGRVLVLAHREELITQAAKRIEDQTRMRVAVEKAEQWARLDSLYGPVDVVVASVQTLKREDRLKRFARDAFATVIVDEAHHATAPGYRAVLDWFEAASVLGVTATPDRLDRVGLLHAFDSAAHRYELRQAIKDGWLAPIVQKRIVCEHLDLSKVRTSKGDLSEKDLQAALAVDRVLHEIAAPLVKEVGTRQTIVFTPGVAAAHQLAAVLAGYGMRAAAIDGTTDSAERRAILLAYERGDVQALVNCGVLTEGFDAPNTAAIAMARPTSSRALYAQCIGRGTRLAPGKTDCLVLDFAGNAGRHALIGPLDVLAGEEVPPEVKERIEKERDTTGRADELLDGIERDVAAEKKRAEAELERRRQAKVRAEARYSSEVVDPWAVGDEYRSAGAFWDDEGAAPMMRAGSATEKQIALLRKFGVDASTWTKAEAGARIGLELGRRQKRAA